MTDNISELLNTIAAQKSTICHLRLENAIQSPTDGSRPIPVLAEYFETGFASNYLALAVLRAEADPLRRHTSPAADILTQNESCSVQQLRLVYYTRDLLDQTESICQQIAFQVGFSSRFSLIRAFRDLEQTTPTEFRLKARG